MTGPGQTPPTPQTVRVIHGAMVAGLILFGLVAHFVMLPKRSPGVGLIPLLPWLLGVSLVGCALGILLSMRVPRPSTNESPDPFWRRAAPLAMIAWTPLEGAGLLAIVVHSLTGSTAAAIVAIVAVIVFLLLNPSYFERR
ncbi:MAG TPA: hypothetical protein VIG78_02515 [Gemmatimonadaceae bacterium]|jgi:hypothetical protein